MTTKSRNSHRLAHIFVSATALLLVGCTIKQHVDPVSAQYVPSAEICIIEDPKVREGFLSEFKAVLRQRGYTARVLPEDSSLTACPTVATYMGRWGWDFTIYMKLAEIRVYAGGKKVGEAIYDSRSGGGRPDKWVDAESKIRELVEELFPVREAAAVE